MSRGAHTTRSYRTRSLTRKTASVMPPRT
jgi:hypothetical protein